jgi:uncharacterized protein (DUF885 family)
MSADAAVNALADRFWTELLGLSPLWATVLGDESSADRWEDPGPDGRAHELALVERTLEEAAGIEGDGLGTEERITLDMLRVVCRMRRRHLELRLWEFDAIDQLAGPQTYPTELARIQPVDTPERLARLHARLERYPALVDAYRENIREGRRSGRTAARQAVTRTLDQVRRNLETAPDRSPILEAHPELPAAARDAIAASVAAHVQPALAALAGELEAYLPDARAGDGVCWLPDGDEVYRHLVTVATTVEDDPRVLHEHGLERIEAIGAEMREVARELGHPSVEALRDALAAERSARAIEPRELVDRARAQVERALAAAPAWFGRLPASSVEVRPVEPHQEQEAPPAFYLPGTPDRSRPGIYFINTFDPASRPLHRLAATTFHEAVPGHHFQLSLEIEHPSLPPFRRFGSRLTGTAYVEGWGLYSERLADEMGLYADAVERFGMLEAQAWRAARLVVDTGIHAFRWDRERSIRLLRDAAGLSQLEAETETDRYITWPGQALAYMTGQREIEALRSSLGVGSGSGPDLRAFHDAVLGHGSLPLATLRAELPGWLSAAPVPAA